MLSNLIDMLVSQPRNVAVPVRVFLILGRQAQQDAQARVLAYHSRTLNNVAGGERAAWLQVPREEAGSHRQRHCLLLCVNEQDTRLHFGALIERSCKCFLALIKLRPAGQESRQ